MSLCLLFELDFFLWAAESCHFPQLVQLSGAIFVKLQVAGVTRQSKPHGQVGNDLDMDQVPLVQLDSSQKAVANGGQAVVKQESPTATGLHFQTREGFCDRF